jgi:chromatin remodeling complex protein RSC6
VLGSGTPISRPQVAKKVWANIKKHKLQDPQKRREIVADDKLKSVFGKVRLDMFQMTKAVSKHLSK